MQNSTHSISSVYSFDAYSFCAPVGRAVIVNILLSFRLIRIINETKEPRIKNIGMRWITNMPTSLELCKK